VEIRMGRWLQPTKLIQQCVQAIFFRCRHQPRRSPLAEVNPAAAAHPMRASAQVTAPGAATNDLPSGRGALASGARHFAAGRAGDRGQPPPAHGVILEQ
jgi:hypothetical protein